METGESTILAARSRRVLKSAKIHGYFARKAGLSVGEAASRVARVAAVRWLEPRGLVPVRIPETSLDLLVDLSTVTGRRIATYGITDYEIEILRRVLRLGDLFIDVGANVGVFSLVGAAAVGHAGRVVACEASPATCALLRRSINFNQLGDRVSVLEAALSDTVGEAEFVAFEAGSGLSSFAPQSEILGRVTTVPTTTLDAIAAGSARPVGLVKIDVEGAELMVVHGGQRLLADQRPPVIVEVEPDHLARQGATLRELQDVFEAAGYTAFEISTCSTSTGPPIALTPVVGDWQRPHGEANLFLAADDSSIQRASGHSAV